MDRPVSRRSVFPTGQASVAKLKSLRTYLERKHGKAASEKWLNMIGLRREELDDETRGVPVLSLYQALQAFEKLAGKDAILATADDLLSPENLGAWMRVLRGTHSPLDAFERLDQLDAEHGRTTQWETAEAREGAWRGVVHITHDPALEEDGLINESRRAELVAIPLAFGLEGAEVELISASVDEAEFMVTWSVPKPWRAAVMGGVGAGLIGSVGLLALPPVLGGPLAALVGFGGALAGAAYGRDRQRRAETRAQAVRVQALERNMALKEGRDAGAAGDMQGSVVAGQYRLKQRMGSGASGVIYEAVRLSDNLPVAIKLLRAAAAHDAVASDRLRREAEALGLAWHPHVVELIDHGHLPDGTTYLVMELLRGESLASRLKTQKTLTSAQLLPIVIQVGEALSAVHAAGVVHRDLKPSNIFLARAADGNGESVKLLDFGIARVEWEEMRITNMGSPLGTPGYMSPEQENGGEIDARSDIFALGAVIHECLLGYPPKSRRSGHWRVGVKASSSPPDSGLHKAAAVIPPPWDALLAKAMAAAPSDRYPDARSFVQAVRTLNEVESERAPKVVT